MYLLLSFFGGSGTRDATQSMWNKYSTTELHLNPW